jgi:hypothetical protein
MTISYAFLFYIKYEIVLTKPIVLRIHFLEIQRYFIFFGMNNYLCGVERQTLRRSLYFHLLILRFFNEKINHSFCITHLHNCV